MTPEYMSEDTFAEHLADIRAAIHLLINNSASRERLRVLRLQEEGSGKTVAEVFSLLALHGMVIVYTSRGRVKRVRTTGMHVRASRGIENLGIAPLTGDPDQRFSIVGHTHRDLAVSGRDISAWIIAGDKQVILSTPTPDLRRPTPEMQLARRMAKWLADNVHAIAADPKAGEYFLEIDQLFDDIPDALSNDE